jgi:replicative DNA helicase
LPVEQLSNRFNTEFQTRMLAVAATQPFFLEMYADVFQPGLFTTQYHRDVCSWIADFYREYHVPPSKSSLRKILREKVQKDLPLYKGYRSLVDRLYESEIIDYEYVKDQVIHAAKFQALRSAFLRMHDQLESGEFDELPMTLNSAMRVGTGVGDVGLDMRTSINEAILKYGVLEEPVRTGFKDIEKKIGGLYEGELTVVVAPPNQGKTAYLGNMALGAAKRDETVIYYTFEIGAYRILNRFYANISKQKTSELYKGIDRVHGAMKRFKLSSSGTVYVKYFPANSVTVDMLKSHLAMVNGNDIRPRLAIFDYGDLIRPSNPKDPPPDRSKQIYRDLRTLGGEYKCHCMSASQSRRSTLYARLIDLDDLSESWGKAGEADTIIPICQTREEKVAGVARAYMAKTRNETSGKFVYTVNDYDHLSVREIDRKRYIRIMNRKGFKVPDDMPGVGRVRRPGGGKDDSELEERYE